MWSAILLLNVGLVLRSVFRFKHTTAAEGDNLGFSAFAILMGFIALSCFAMAIAFHHLASALRTYRKAISSTQTSPLIMEDDFMPGKLEGKARHGVDWTGKVAK